MLHTIRHMYLKYKLSSTSDPTAFAERSQGMQAALCVMLEEVSAKVRSLFAHF